jgi:hypothetical protein
MGEAARVAELTREDAQARAREGAHVHRDVVDERSERAAGPPDDVADDEDRDRAARAGDSPGST